MWRTEYDPIDPGDLDKPDTISGEGAAADSRSAEGLGGAWGPAESGGATPRFAVARNVRAVVPKEESLFGPAETPWPVTGHSSCSGFDASFASTPRRIRTIGVFVDQAWQVGGDAVSGDSGSLLASLGIRRPVSLGERAGIGAAVLRGIRAMSDRRDFRLLLLPNALSTDGDASGVLRRLRDNGIAGMILGPGYADTHATRLADAGVPVVLLMQETRVPEGCGGVAFREEQVVDRALSFLWERGHRRIAFLSECALPGLEADSLSRFAVASNLGGARSGDEAALRRFGAYIAFMTARRVQEPSLYGFAGGPDVERQIEQTIARWQHQGTKSPTAVFCPTPEIARALLGAAARRRVSVPGDLSVLAVDTEDALFARTSQPLTCVHLPAEQIGREAARVLIAMLAGRMPEVEGIRRVLPVDQIIDRGSVAAA